jgi:hypothetical protein
VITRQQHIGNAFPAVFGWSRVLRVLKKAGCVRVVGDRFLAMTHGTGQEPDDGVDDYEGRNLPSSEDIIPNTDFFCGKRCAGPFIDAFIPAADKYDVLVSGQPFGVTLAIGVALGREYDDGSIRWWTDGIKGFKQWFGAHDHAWAAAEGRIIDGAMAVVGVVAEIVNLDMGETRSLGTTDDACTKYGLEHFREDGDDVNFHGISVPAIIAGELPEGMGENRK